MVVSNLYAWYSGTSRSSLIRQLESLSDLFDGDQDPRRTQERVWCSKHKLYATFSRRKWTYYSKTFMCLHCNNLLGLPITSVECERSFSVLLCQLTHNRPVSVESRAHSCGTLCKTSWPGRRALKISFVLTTSVSMTLDCRLVGSNAKLLTLAMCQWLCYSVNMWHGECDEPDGGKRGILLWRTIVYWCYRFPVVI